MRLCTTRHAQRRIIFIALKRKTIGKSGKKKSRKKAFIVCFSSGHKFVFVSLFQIRSLSIQYKYVIALLVRLLYYFFQTCTKKQLFFHFEIKEWLLIFYSLVVSAKECDRALQIGFTRFLEDYISTRKKWTKKHIRTDIDVRNIHRNPFA